MSSPVHTLYDMPISNNGARCRVILYKKQIPQDQVKIVSPADLGGLKSEQYLRLNPQGKMPLLRINNDTANSLSAIPESDTICRYLLSHYKDKSPSFLPDDTKSNLISRLHDMYITPIQGCLYRKAPPFGSFPNRKDALKELSRQLDTLNTLVSDYTYQDGIYLCGKDVSLADATIFPTCTFMRYMFPKYQGYLADPTLVLPKNLEIWYSALRHKDEHFEKIHQEIHSALELWNQHKHWDTIRLAGIRDTNPATIFDQIIAKKIPAYIVKEDDKVLSFKDINPVAPAHVLIIPKERQGLVRLQEATNEHVDVLGRMMVMAGEIIKDETLGFGDGARIVVNDGKDGGQEVSHLHVHVLGGRHMKWPPG